MIAVTVTHITSNVSNQTHSQGPANKQVGLSSEINGTSVCYVTRNCVPVRLTETSQVKSDRTRYLSYFNNSYT